jgi:hypothetical protein
MTRDSKCIPVNGRTPIGPLNYFAGLLLGLWSWTRIKQQVLRNIINYIEEMSRKIRELKE